ncbi:hypothetical protein SAMN03097699_0452 [Flavobacteriaceae bacterium MAR_2010_188]|nr:hypothetical protein SAMN03097699_0452 [Flavobacteriaceae bacterium MAR_2010_188]
MKIEKPNKETWSKLYSIVLIVNLVYILVFYILMQLY